MFALIFDGQVAQVAAEQFPVATGLFWTDCPDDVQPGWLYDGDDFTDTTPPLDLKAELAAYRSKVAERPVTYAGQSITPTVYTRNALGQTIQLLEHTVANYTPDQSPDELTIDWQTDDGFLLMTLTDLYRLGQTIGAQVQKSFSVKKAIAEKIEQKEIITVGQLKTLFDQGMAQ